MDTSLTEKLLASRTRLVVLAPHLDDAVWSCGGLIARAVDAGCPLEVVTVYSALPEGLALPRLQRRAQRVNGDYPRRKAEDAAALARLGTTPTWWDFHERLFRPPWLSRTLQVFDTPPGEVVRGGEPYAALEARIAAKLAEAPEAVLLAPLGAGHMYDHVELFTASASAAARAGALGRTLFYEDSYAIYTGARRRHFLLAGRVWPARAAPERSSLWWRAMAFVMSRAASATDLRTCLPDGLADAAWRAAGLALGDTLGRKLAALGEYDSQMRQFGGMDRVGAVFARYHQYWEGCEPYWRCEASGTVSSRP
jgi:LmbE family N-acetylglucosaminyl deacetylase